jgi:hypothetical protein
VGRLYEAAVARDTRPLSPPFVSPEFGLPSNGKLLLDIFARKSRPSAEQNGAEWRCSQHQVIAGTGDGALVEGAGMQLDRAHRAAQDDDQRVF